MKPVIGCRTIYLGTFLLCLSLLAFEILSVRTLGFVLGSSFIYFAIAIAMLGLSAAASLMTLWTYRPVGTASTATLLAACLVLAGLLIVTYSGSAAVKSELNEALGEAGHNGGLNGLIHIMVAQSFGLTLKLGAIIALPYFVFGFVITYLFSTTPPEIYTRLYLADLIGGSIGCIVAYLAMEYVSIGTAMLMPVALAAAAGAVFAWSGGPKLRTIGCGATIIVISAAAVIVGSPELEPAPSPNLLARDYQFKREVHEVWRGWNSFSRVGALEWQDERGETRRVMALGNGDGHANLIPYSADDRAELPYLPSKLAMALGIPQDALVIFAGGGADMLAIDRYARGESRITGVEINHTLVDGAMAIEDLRLGEFLSRPGIKLVKAEGRAFIQRDDSLYDVILLSWSGTTISYYAGSIGATTQFVYTREGLAAILNRLKPGGFVVMLQINKIVALAALRSIFEARDMERAEKAAIVLYQPGQEYKGWDKPWDDNSLLIKPDGFTDDEVAQIRDTLAGDGWRLAYDPVNGSIPEFAPYEQVLAAPNLDDALENINRETNLRFSIPTDDRPFYLDIFATKNYISGEFWRRTLGGSTQRSQDVFRAARVLFVAGIAVAAVVLIIGPMLFYRRGGLKAFGPSHLTYFFALGTGFMFLEIGIMHKLSLLFGNPGLSIAIVLASLIFFTGLGSLTSERLFARAGSFRLVVLAIIGYVSLYLAFNGQLIELALGWPIIGKATLVFVVLAPAGILLGQLFPQGLKLVSADNANLVPWAWAINGAAGTVAAGISPLVAQAAGFNALLVAGAVIYASILLLPEYRGKARIL